MTFPPSFERYQAVNYTVTAAVQAVQAASQWRGVYTVEFDDSRAYVGSLLVVFIFLLALFVVFAGLICVLCVSWRKHHVSTQFVLRHGGRNLDRMWLWRISVGAMAPVLFLLAYFPALNACTQARRRARRWAWFRGLEKTVVGVSKQRPIASAARKATERLQKRRARQVFTGLVFVSWVLYLTCFFWNISLAASETGFKTGLDSIQSLFQVANASALQLNANIYDLSQQLALQNQSCPFVDKPRFVSNETWAEYQTNMVASFAYMSTSLEDLSLYLEQYLVLLGPAMVDIISNVQLITAQISYFRVLVVSLMLGALLVLIPVLLWCDWYCSARVYSTKNKWKRRFLEWNNNGMTACSLLVLLLLTAMAGLLFAVLFLGSDMCYPDPMVFFARMGANLEMASPTFTQPSRLDVVPWCNSVLANTSTPLVLYPPPGQDLLPPVPVSVEAICYYATCEGFYNRSVGVERVRDSFREFYLPVLVSNRVLVRLFPELPCTQFMDATANATRVVLTEAFELLNVVSCSKVNPVLAEVLYYGLCTQYVYMESVLVGLALAANVLLAGGIVISVVFDLTVDSKEEHDAKEEKKKKRRERREARRREREAGAGAGAGASGSEKKRSRLGRMRDWVEGSGS